MKGERLAFVRSLTLALLMLVFVFPLHAQFLRTSYFMEGSHYRQQLNPALTPGRGYINIPVIGSFNMSVTSNSLGFDDVGDILENEQGSDYFTSDKFINKLKSSNDLNLNFNTDILSAGWYKGCNFWSFNVGLRMDLGASIPKSVFSFMRETNGFDMDNIDWTNYSRELGRERLNINAYAEVGVGYARQINDRLTVGGRVKALLGMSNLSLDIKTISVNTSLQGIDSNTDWSSLTPEQIENIHGTADIKVEASLESSVKGLELKENENGYIDDISYNSDDLGFAGYGGAIDLGASYKLLDKLTLSAAVLDLGFISWSKGSTKIASAKTDGLSFDSNKEGDIERFAEIISSGEVLNYDMLNMEVDEGSSKSRTKWLHSTLVFGAEYELLNQWLVLGLLSTTRFTQPKTMTELTLSANVRPSNAFNFAVSYSAIQSAGKSLGLALKLGSAFVGTDYMFFGGSTKCFNVFFGVSIPLAKKKVYCRN